MLGLPPTGTVFLWPMPSSWWAWWRHAQGRVTVTSCTHPSWRGAGALPAILGFKMLIPGPAPGELILLASVQPWGGLQKLSRSLTVAEPSLDGLRAFHPVMSHLMSPCGEYNGVVPSLLLSQWCCCGSGMCASQNTCSDICWTCSQTGIAGAQGLAVSFGGCG